MKKCGINKTTIQNYKETSHSKNKNINGRDEDINKLDRHYQLLLHFNINELTIIDKLCILLNLRIGCVSPEFKATLLCAETKKQYTFKLDLKELLQTIINYPITYIDTISLENIKVTIQSISESITTETKIGDTSTSTDSFKQKILSLGNATVRSPEYEILNVHESKDGFKAQVLVKKLKRQHIEETARDLEFIDADKLLDMLE